MTKSIGAAGLLLASATLAQAGALDRTGQPVTVLFEEGNYVELSYAFTTPDVEGSFAGSVSSGGAAPSFGQGALALKYDVTDRISLGLVLDQPFGADIDYDETDPGYPLAGSEAEFRSTGVTALGRYRFNDAFSVHAGLRYVAIDADLVVASPVPTPAGLVPVSYTADYDRDGNFGYVVGGAYERPEIALRVALTYSSDIEFSNSLDYAVTTPAGTAPGTGEVEYTMPQSVNLDLRTGIAPGTVLFGGVRWVDWSETEINTPGYPFGLPVVDYDGDYVTYALGVGRQFGERIRGAASLVYEDGIGGAQSNLSPTDGQFAVIVGGTYLAGNGVELSSGVRYAWLGDATTQAIGAEFEDNDALSLALRVAYRF